MTFSLNVWFLNGLFQAGIIFEADRCIRLAPNTPSPIFECHIVGHWDMSGEENHINIAKPCRQLVQELMNDISQLQLDIPVFEITFQLTGYFSGKAEEEPLNQNKRSINQLWVSGYSNLCIPQWVLFVL